MIVFSLGLPSRFAEWCDRLSARLAEQAWGATELARADTLDEVALTVIRTRSPNLVVGSRQPSIRLGKAISEAGGGFILALDDPRRVLHDLATRDNRDFVEAVRAVARSCASIAGLAETPGALVLKGAVDQADAEVAATTIAQHFGLRLSPAEITGIVGNLGAPPPELGGDDAWWAGLDDRSRAIAAGALESYASFFSGEEIGSVTWERDLFFISQETPGACLQPASRPIDITGRSRCLIFGPYLTLPVGAWSAIVSLGTSPEAAEMTYLVEIVAESRLASVRVEPGPEHLIEAELRFTIDDTRERPLEIRVWNERAAFDGQLALGYVTLTPRAPIRGETREFFATALQSLPVS